MCDVCNRNIVVSKRDGTQISFVTKYSDGEIQLRLYNLTAEGGKLVSNNFAQSLAIARKPSATQLNWMHKLVMDAETPVQPKPQLNVAYEAPELSKLVDLLDAAGKVLKKPSITLQLANGNPIRISRCPDNHKKCPGQLYVAAPGYGSTYYGRVTREGVMVPARDYSPEVDALLHRLQSDPAQVAAEYGKLTGRCCFCNLTLTDERSTRVGYGPVCAKNFGLPWTTKEVEAVLSKAGEAMEDAMDYRGGVQGAFPEDVYA